MAPASEQVQFMSPAKWQPHLSWSKLLVLTTVPSTLMVSLPWGYNCRSVQYKVCCCVFSNVIIHPQAHAYFYCLNSRTWARNDVFQGYLKGVLSLPVNLSPSCTTSDEWRKWKPPNKWVTPINNGIESSNILNIYSERWLGVRQATKQCMWIWLNPLRLWLIAALLPAHLPVIPPDLPIS